MMLRTTRYTSISNNKQAGREAGRQAAGVTSAKWEITNVASRRSNKETKNCYYYEIVHRQR
jgi:hypothetical protein